MATLSDLESLLDRLAKSSEGMTLEEFKRAVMGEIKQQFASDKIYVPARHDCKKDKIIEAAKKLPTSVVVERYGVSRQYVSRLVRNKK